MIAVDAMGGDRAPSAIVQGAVTAAQEGISVVLYGDESELTLLLQEYVPNWQSLPLEIVHTTQTITMDDEPSKSVKRKTDASLVRAMKAVSSGDATAFVSAGNSGAVLAASIFYNGRLPGVLRPAVGCFLPTRVGSIFCLDVGANVDCKAAYLHQFALMGHLYVRIFQGNDNPRIALLSNGHEPYKGSAEVKKVYDILAHAPVNFVGNIESRDIFDNHADVLVCDGFVGNVLLKAIQGTSQALAHWLKHEAIRASWWERLFLQGTWRLFTRMKRKTDYATTGGALLLGVQHPVILAHGRSDARAVANAIRFAQRVVDQGHLLQFNSELVALIRSHATFTGAVKQKVRSIFHWGQS